MSDAIDDRQRLKALAHELRNPLAAVQGALDLLQDPTPGREGEQEEMLELIARQVQTMTQIIDDLLDAARS